MTHLKVMYFNNILIVFPSYSKTLNNLILTLFVILFTTQLAGFTWEISRKKLTC